MPPSPTILTFQSSSPSRDTPNSHPYAIKTSSSAVLTRSNSTGHRYPATHHYTPISLAKDSVGTRKSRYVPSHKHTRSLPSSIADPTMFPPPVPLPPSSTLPARLANPGHANRLPGSISDGERIPPTPPSTWRLKRNETLPSVFPNRTDTEMSVQDLPKNPKIWTPGQLSVYLSSTLRMKGGAKLPMPVVRDIGVFVMNEHLSGRAFLRMNTEDYAALGINQLWKDALLDANRALRQNLVQGRIMGFASGPPQSPASTEELLLVPEEDDSVPSALPPCPPLDLSHRPSPASRQWEEDKTRMSKTSFRSGRVRGMVETYERSFSESSGSGSECDDRDEVSAQFGTGELVGEPEDEGDFASGEETSASEDEGDATMVSVTSSDGAGSDPLSANVPKGSISAFPEHSYEPSCPPSVEVLLHEHEGSKLQNDRYHSWGAKAWEDEADDPTGIHATAKRIPLNTPLLNQEIQPREDGITASSRIGSEPRGLIELFSQSRTEEMPPTETTRDLGVSVRGEAEDDTRVPGPAVYELLKEFQRRLETVENRLAEMERQDKEKDKHLQQPGNKDEQHYAEKATATHDIVAVGSEHYHLPSSDVVYHDELEEEAMIRNYTATDPSIYELSRYMLLVSLGVVAITASVVLNRVVGGRRRA
ncbi:hypothetical protein JB92DRAFT_2958798 [Gautieria morchelliformis]|nr:hypothetical protein JB92DRAFT_2958798 [Gautieria morchelliformis]